MPLLSVTEAIEEPDASVPMYTPRRFPDPVEDVVTGHVLVPVTWFIALCINCGATDIRFVLGINDNFDGDKGWHGALIIVDPVTVDVGELTFPPVSLDSI